MADYALITIARFWSKVSVGAPNSCWPWRAAVDDHGYGRFTLPDGEEVKAHRFSWELANGPVPPGAMILHSCDNPPCCNPRHGRPGDAKANAEDCWSRGRGYRAVGAHNGKAKLTDSQVAAIRADQRKGGVIAAEYNVSQALVSMIRKGARRA